MTKEQIPPAGTWSDEHSYSLIELEKDRSLTLRATRKLLANFCNAHILQNATVLEIGSGLGFLKRNLPEDIYTRWIQLDAQPHFLHLAKARSPKETYVCGSAYKLPFPDESLDVVCGFSSFDVSPDLNSAVGESYRALKKGGLFFHMLDLRPNPEVMDKYIQETSLTPPKNAEEEYQYFQQRLALALQAQFKQKPEIMKLSASFVGKKTASQEQEGSTVFNHEAPDLIRFLRLVLLATICEGSITHLKRFSPKLAAQFGPTAIELSTIRCVKVKK